MDSESQLEIHKFSNGEFLHVLLLDEVENFQALNEVVSDNLNIVLLNPELILNVFQIYVSTWKALSNKANNKMITKSFQSEVLFSLSPSKNIATSIKTFSASEHSKSVLIAAVHDTDEKAYLKGKLEKVKCAFKQISDLESFSKMEDIKKLYGITDKEQASSLLIDSIVTRISTKDFL